MSWAGYNIPVLGANFTLKSRFQFHGIDKFFLISLCDADDGEAFFDFSLIAIDGQVYYWIGVGDSNGNIIGIRSDLLCTLAPDVWHDLQMRIEGTAITVLVDGPVISSFTAASAGILAGLNYLDLWNDNDDVSNLIRFSSLTVENNDNAVLTQWAYNELVSSGITIIEAFD